MVQCKITVLKISLHADLAEKYCKEDVTPCPLFEEGQFFISGLEKPEGFCDWAWNDILPYVLVLLTGGNFCRGMFQGWMKDHKSMIACCTDGIRPVSFHLELIEDQI